MEKYLLRERVKKSTQTRAVFSLSVFMLPVPVSRGLIGGNKEEMEGDPQVQSGLTLPCQDKWGKVRFL